MLRGRGPERATLKDLVDRARGGRGGALVLRGEPGVGKSALLADLVEQLGDVPSDVVVVRTHGVESEAPLPFAALHRLLRPLLSQVGNLPPPQAHALRAAFGEIDQPARDRHLFFLAVLNVLSEAASEHPPLVAIVDDAQWLDEASAAALLFVARRLEGEAIALIFAVRSGEAGDLDLRDITAVDVVGVDAQAAGEIISDHTRGVVASEVRTELAAATAGNPLGLVELAEILTPRQLSGREPIPRRLPLTAGVEAAFLDRYHRLSEAAQTLLLVAAADDSGHASVVERAAAQLGAGPAALEAAETSGLISVREGILSMRHPLVRSAIYGSTTSLRRRQTHRALADELAGTPDDDRRAWHLAAAADEPDEAVVAALDAAAERARQRGGHEASAAAWSRAAELTRDPHARASRLFSAAQASLDAGRPLETDRLVRGALFDAADPILRAELLQLRGQVEWNTRSLNEGYHTVCEAAAAAAPHDPTRARVLAMLAASLGAFGAQSPEAADPATIVDEPRAGAEIGEVATSLLLQGFSAVASSDWKGASEAFRSAWALDLNVDASPLLHANLAIAAVHVGDDQRALRMFGGQVEAGRHLNAVTMIEHGLTRGAVFQIATGAWGQAISSAQEALLLDRNLGLDELVVFPMAELALLAALRGDDQAPQFLDELDRALTTRPLGGVTSGIVSGLRHWAAGCQAGIAAGTAVHHFAQIDSQIVRGLGAIDGIEAAVRADRRDVAESWVRDLRTFAEGADMPWAWAAMYHGKGVLAGGTGYGPGSRDDAGAGAESAFKEALRWHARSPRTPDRARTLLALGEHLRRLQRRADARTPLREALDLFESLGAAGWAERARQELRASGESTRRRDRNEPTKLTAQEAQVAEQVRLGLSNKEAAARLFISPRTVDFHLRNVYLKLGITSRTELVSLTSGPLTDQLSRTR